MPDMSIYRPYVKTLLSLSAEQLTTKTNEFIEYLMGIGVNPELIYISPPSCSCIPAPSGGGYILCNTVTYHIPINKDPSDLAK